MTENNGRFPALNLNTLITVATMGAAIAGTWSVMGERIKTNAETAREIRTHIYSVDARLIAAEREIARTEIRLENLRRDLDDLRRQP